MLIHNLAKYYYDARPLEAPAGARDGGNGDITGFRVWESAPNLIRYLDRHRSIVRSQTVLELGSGTGAVGLSAAAFGADHVVLSDADSTVTLAGEHGWDERSRLTMLRDNIRLNGERGAAMSVEPLRWGDDAHIVALRTRWPAGFSTIVASDVLYAPRMYEALQKTIHALAAQEASVVLSFPVRHGEEHTFADRLAPAFELVRREDDAPPSTAAKASLRIIELKRGNDL